MILWRELIEQDTKRKVRRLLDAVQQRPTELPISEIVEIAETNMAVTLDLNGREPVAYVSPRPDPRFDALTAREYEVATLMAAGFSNAQIADTLFISTGTVKDHVHAILTKTGLESRTEVAACWYNRI